MLFEQNVTSNVTQKLGFSNICFILRKPYKTTQDCKKSASSESHKSFKTMQNHAKLREQCESICNHMKTRKTMRNHAKLSQTTPNHAKPCKTLQNHGQPHAIMQNIRIMRNHAQPQPTTCNHMKQCPITRCHETMQNHAKPSQTTHNSYWEHIETF